MNLITYPAREEWPEIIKRTVFDTRSLDNKVKKILDDIQLTGDEALKKYTFEFDGVKLETLEVGQEAIKLAKNHVSAPLKDAIYMASENIRKFHESQVTPVKKIETSPGVTCWQKSVAIEKVGIYVPGGTAPLFSTVLMLAIPAAIAGCREVVLCTPPGKDGNVHPAILFAAELTGVTRVFKLGGVQAIGAMAYSTRSVPRVYKILGPGNQYVTAAKQLVARDNVAIDMPAGPSEVAIMADETSNPAFIASDLLSQAEHGKDSQVLLVCTDQAVLTKVQEEVYTQLNHLPREKMARDSLVNSKLILVKDKEDMVSLINEYAPEHLIIATKDYMVMSEKILNAGSVFLGQLTPESAGDYVSGTNHTLPTNGYAKMYNGVNLDDYVKKITYQEVLPDGLRNIGNAIEIMAEAEDLQAHKNAVTLRLNLLRK